MKQASILHLFIHRILLDHCNNGCNIIKRKQFQKIINHHIKFKETVTLRESLIKELIKLGMVEDVNQQKIAIINSQVSSSLDNLIEGNYKAHATRVKNQKKK